MKTAEKLNEMQSLFTDNQINARKIHEFLESKYSFDDWIQDRIDLYEFAEEWDYIVRSSDNSDEPGIEYHLSKETAIEFLMLEDNSIGRMCRIYFMNIAVIVNSGEELYSEAQTDAVRLTLEEITAKELSI